MITSDNQWKTFVFMGYGLRSDRNLRRCPATARRAGRHSRPAHRLFSSQASAFPTASLPHGNCDCTGAGPPEQCWIEVGGQRAAGARARQWCSTICIPTRSITTPMACAPVFVDLAVPRAGEVAEPPGADGGAVYRRDPPGQGQPRCLGTGLLRQEAGARLNAGSWPARAGSWAGQGPGGGGVVSFPQAPPGNAQYFNKALACGFQAR